MSYWRYWQLQSAPFTNESPLFRGSSVEEALARIEFLIGNRRSVGSLMGVSGVGKSSVLRHCAANPPTGADLPSLQILRMSMLGLTSGELLTALAMRLVGARRPADPTAAWTALGDYFQAASREETQTVLLVDDTESSSAAAEADLARLLAAAFPLTVVFSVETQLASAISRGLFERCELQIELPSWHLDQTSEFLASTFRTLGCRKPIFTDRAVEQIQNLSFGIARRIIQLTDLALVAGAVAGMDCVDSDCVEQVSWELPKALAA